jgi:hypothetical protein
MIALNADDDEYFEVTKGTITDIQIDRVWATNCFRAVRFLSSGTPIKRISISNIFGSYFRNTIAFTHWRFDVTKPPRFEDISINNIFTAKITDKELLGKLSRGGKLAIIGIEGQLSFNNLTVSNVFRTEWMPNAGPTIWIQQGTVIETLHLRNIQQTNMTDVPLTFFHNDARVLHLFIDGVVIYEKDAGKSIPTKGIGRVLYRHGDIIIYGEQELKDETNRANEDILTNPQEYTIL